MVMDLYPYLGASYLFMQVSEIEASTVEKVRF